MNRPYRRECSSLSWKVSFPKFPLGFAEGKQGFLGSGYPADACGAICLSFRALVRPSQNIRSSNLEMIQAS
jgi:hypothetical protein